MLAGHGMVHKNSRGEQSRSQGLGNIAPKGKSATDIRIRVDRVEPFYNHMVMERRGHAYQPANLDAVFAALADSTRRAILSRLAAGEASVNEIAAPFEMSQPAVSKHLKVLEQAGLIERDVDKQRRPARLKAEPMAAAVNWLEEFKRFWSSSFDQLDGLLEELKKAKTKRSRK
jgi:DNA-binding transcriptional ArsR family regulator